MWSHNSDEWRDQRRQLVSANRAERALHALLADCCLQWIASVHVRVRTAIDREVYSGL